jgi:hypothetical protein
VAGKVNSCKIAGFPCGCGKFGDGELMPASVKEKRPTLKLARQSGPALFEWRRAAGLNRGTFARMANFSERSLASYEKLEHLPDTIQPQINEALRLVKALLDIIPAGGLSAWLQTPNSGFGGSSPWSLIENGERDLIWEMIHQTRHGAFA